MKVTNGCWTILYICSPCIPSEHRQGKP